MVCKRWNLRSAVLSLILPVGPSSAPVACTEAPRPAVTVPRARDGVRQAGGRRSGTYSLLALGIVFLVLLWAGTGAVALPEGDRLLVTSEGGFLIGGNGFRPEASEVLLNQAQHLIAQAP